MTRFANRLLLNIRPSQEPREAICVISFKCTDVEQGGKGPTPGAPGSHVKMLPNSGFTPQMELSRRPSSFFSVWPAFHRPNGFSSLRIKEHNLTKSLAWTLRPMEGAWPEVELSCPQGAVWDSATLPPAFPLYALNSVPHAPKSCPPRTLIGNWVFGGVIV